VQRRLGAIEQLERSEGVDLGLRVFLGNRVAIVSGTDASRAGFAALAERAVAMARVVPEDSFATLLDAPAPPSADALELHDDAEPDAEALLARAALAEEAAMAVPGVSNSEGASAGWSRATRSLATSRGFFGEYARGSHSVSATALAGAGTDMQRDYDYASAAFLGDLDDAAAIGRRAGEQAVARLNPSRPRSGVMPVLYHPRVAGSLLGHLAGAINGASIARGTSFLKDAMGTAILPRGMTVWDDPTRPRGPRSRPFDGEGQPGARRALVEDGVLSTWLLDGRSARQLGLASTGHAGRGTSGPPSPGPEQPVARSRRADAGRADGRHTRGAVRDRADRHGRQRPHRRLFARRRRLHDPRRGAGRAGGRDHHRRQAARHVPRDARGERPRLPPRHRCADAARGRDDARRKLTASLPAGPARRARPC
jgi:PmbA protein